MIYGTDVINYKDTTLGRTEDIYFTGMGAAFDRKRLLVKDGSEQFATE